MQCDEVRIGEEKLGVGMRVNWLEGEWELKQRNPLENLLMCDNHAVLGL